MTSTLQAVIAAGQDFEWYPTTDKMIDVVKSHLSTYFESIMDIGAGDGRVLMALAKKSDREPKLYAIEKSTILIQAHPEDIIPVGVDFYEQNLATLPTDYIFCNPPYSDYETWVIRIIESGYAEKAFLVIPRRWKESAPIATALEKRKAKARVIHSDTFENAERAARAVIDIVEITFPSSGYRNGVTDPFDIWFDENVKTFDREKETIDDPASSSVDLAKVRNIKTIHDLVESFNEDYARMEQNYKTIFELDYELLRELAISKEKVREGIKKRIAGLKTTYWKLLFERLDVITNRLSTATKQKFLDRLTGRTGIAFTSDNAYAVVLWALKHANKYYDQQLVTLFRDLTDQKFVHNYKSNLKTWNKDGWRYNKADHDHYVLDYRVVVEKYHAFYAGDGFGRYDYPGNIHTNCHALIDDCIAVFSNLGFMLDQSQQNSRSRVWNGGSWEDFVLPDGRTLFQVKAYQNGNLHFRFLPEALRALNIEAGRLLGWVHSAAEVEQEMGYSAEEAATYFGSNRQLTVSNVKLLSA